MPKKTTAIIKETGSDYVIGVKNNQPSLYKAIATTMQDRDNICSTYATLETNKGRIAWRSVAVSNCIGLISKEWVGLQQLVKVERHRKTEKGWQAAETAYFISSLATNALDYMEGIRQHWGIENGLHYVKDMVMGEDDCRIRTRNAPQNLSVMRTISINLLRINKNSSVTKAIRLTANDIPALKQMIT